MVGEQRLDPAPRFPAGRQLGIGILGAGSIARTAHLPAYEKYGLRVVGAWTRTPSRADELRDKHPTVGRVYDSPDALLADPDVDVVDLAMGPDDRADWVRRAVRAGKHVLAQKPLTFDVDSILPVLDEADERGVLVAVNQNARWAPPWRLATQLVLDGAIGDVVGVTHLHDKPLPPIAGTPFDDIPHMLISDYLVHWIDITRCWLEGQRAHAVRAHDHRVPGQPESTKNPWSATVQIDTAEGAGALLRVVGDVHATAPGCPFWVHGTRGSLRGSLLGRDHLELDVDGRTRQLPLQGAWFVDGFAGAMGELMCAIDEDRQPYNSARHNLASLRLVLAARDSAERGGATIDLDEQL